MIAVRRTKAGALTERVARLLLGEPSGVDCEKGTQRYGDVSVNLNTGKFYDFDDETSGTHIELIQRVKGLHNGQAEAWLEENITNAKPLPLPAESAPERALIGMLAARPELMAAIEEEITIDHFGEIVNKQMFMAINLASLTGGLPVSMNDLMNAAGGDPLLPVFDGYTLAVYVANIVAEAPSAPDAAHLARMLAVQIRTAANREGDIDDEYDTEPEPAPFVSRFGGIMFEQLDEPGPEYAYLVDDTITVGDKSIIGGASRSGKSFLAIHMGMCIATARPFFGRKILTPGLVIYQAGEGGRGIKKRFRAWRKHFGVTAGQRVPIYILQSKVDIHSADGDTANLIAEIEGISRLYGMPVIALFIDTLQKAQGHADENSGRDMGIVMANVDRIAAAMPGCHVCLVHHMNAGGTKLRGHTSVYAGIDQVILVSKDEDSKVRTALLDKQKDDEDGSEIRFELKSIEIGRRAVDDKPITSCVCLPTGERPAAPSAAPKGPRLTHERTVILQALRTAIEDYGEPPPPVLHLPRSISRVVNANRWKEIYLTKAPDPDAPANTINKRLRDASNQFQNLSLIGRENPFVWLTGKEAHEDLFAGVPDAEFPEQIR